MHRQGSACSRLLTCTGPASAAEAWAASTDPATGTGSDPADGSIRHELVARVRREIEAGTYDTPERLEAALERLLGSLTATAV